MSVPTVTITELDGALGITPAGGIKPLAILGCAEGGTPATPGSYGRSQDVVTDFTSGPLVRAATYHIENFQQPVVCVSTAIATDGSYPASSATVQTSTGTCVITVDDANTYPDDDYQVYFIVTAAGTIGVAGITFKYSLDNGRTLSPDIALGTATEYVIPNSGGVELEFAAGTLDLGDTATFRCDAPIFDSTGLAAAFTALRQSALEYDIIHVVGAQDATTFAQVGTSVTALKAAGKYKAWVGHCRMPNLAETEAQYLTAMNTIFSALADTSGSLCAGAVKTTSPPDGKQLRRPPSFYVASKTATVSEEINIADLNLGSATGLVLTDANGNPEEHDESISPGLDAARFCVLRTVEGIAGVYVNRPQLFSAAGSDYELMPHRRIINLAKAALRVYFMRRLNKAIKVDTSTGYILESEAQEIEAGAHASVAAVLDPGPKASGGGFAQGRYVQLSRTDNLISTKTMTVQCKVVPLAYPEAINVSVGFSNPAMALVTT